MNWQGLLNWSLNYTDGTRPSEFKPMDEERKAWLKAALESLIVDHVEVLRKSSEILSTLEDGSEENRKEKENAAELLLDPIENLDCSLNFIKIDGFKHVIRCMIGSQYLGVRKTCAQVFTSCVQNNPPVQKYAIEHHAVEGLFAAIKEEQDLPLKELLISCLSSLVRGHFNGGREIFLSLNGIEMVHSLLLEKQSVRIIKKSLLMLSDFLYNTRSKADERVNSLMSDLGVFNTLQGLSENGDQEMAEMIEMIVYNSRNKFI